METGDDLTWTATREGEVKEEVHQEEVNQQQQLAVARRGETVSWPSAARLPPTEDDESKPPARKAPPCEAATPLSDSPPLPLTSSTAVAVASLPPLLREWNHGRPDDDLDQQHLEETEDATPVAAIVLDQSDDEQQHRRRSHRHARDDEEEEVEAVALSRSTPARSTPATAERSGGYSYPVATFVRDWVRTGMDHVIYGGPRSHRSRDDDDDDHHDGGAHHHHHHHHYAAAAEDGVAEVQAYTTTTPSVLVDWLDEADPQAEFILVDGDLIALPVSATEAYATPTTPPVSSSSSWLAASSSSSAYWPDTAQQHQSQHHDQHHQQQQQQQQQYFQQEIERRIREQQRRDQQQQNPLSLACFPTLTTTSSHHSFHASRTPDLENPVTTTTTTASCTSSSASSTVPPAAADLASPPVVPPSRFRRGLRKIAKIFRPHQPPPGPGSSSQPTKKSRRQKILEQLEHQQQQQTPPPAPPTTILPPISSQPPSSDAPVSRAVTPPLLETDAETGSAAHPASSSALNSVSDHRSPRAASVDHSATTAQEDVSTSGGSYGSSTSPNRAKEKSRLRRSWRRSEATTESETADSSVPSPRSSQRSLLPEMLPTEQAPVKGAGQNRSTGSMDTTTAAGPHSRYGSRRRLAQSDRNMELPPLPAALSGDPPPLPPPHRSLAGPETPSTSASSASSGGRAQSVTASFVGTADQVMGSNHPAASGLYPSLPPAPHTGLDEGLQDLVAAVTYIESDDDYNYAAAMKKEEDGYFQPSLVPRDVDYKVDKADAPDVESMLRRAEQETHDDLLEAGGGILLDHYASPSPAPKRVRRGKSDGSSVPLTQATVGDELVHNDTLKIVVVSAPSVDKSWLARSLRNSQKRPRKRATLGVDVHSWTLPPPSVASLPGSSSSVVTSSQLDPNYQAIKCQIWDVQGATGHSSDQANFGYHAGTQSLFFSERSLYLLVWDLGGNNPATYLREDRKRPALSSPYKNQVSDDDEEEENVSDDDDHHEDDDGSDLDDENEYVREKANRQADHALHADIVDRVVSWVDCITNRGKNSAILPVGLIPEGMSTMEVKRRCDMMQNLLEEHVHHHIEHIPNAPKLLTGTETILCVNYADGSGMEHLQQTIVAIATDTSGSVFDHVGTPVPRGTVEVLEAVNRFKRDHKLIRLDHVLAEMDSVVPVDEIIEALHFLACIGEIMYFGHADDDVLSSYIILSRKWLVSALSCILRNDLKRELADTRRFMNMQCIYSEQTFDENDIIKTLVTATNSNCPLLSDEDAKMLWQSMSFMKEASDRYSQISETSTSTPTMFYFLERLLVHSGIFLPLERSTTQGLLTEGSDDVYFVPSLLALADPRDIWTYKSSESWMTTLCHSWLFRDGAPSNLMERLTVALLRDLYAFSKDFRDGEHHSDFARRNQTFPFGLDTLSGFLHDHNMQALGHTRIHQLVCWKSSFLVKIGTVFADHESGELRESFVEVIVAVVDQSANHCVASDAMRSNMHRVVVSGKGQVGHHGRKLWKGGYEALLKSVRNTLSAFSNVEEQVVCPECLAHSDPRSASTWSWDSVVALNSTGSPIIRCMRGHRIDSNLICGRTGDTRKVVPPLESVTSSRMTKPVSELLPSVVLVALWDCNMKKIRNVGSGFLVDKKYGLVVTAGHTLFIMEEGRRFGSPYGGLADAKVIVGVIPDNKSHDAVFRYVADIVADDIHCVDACVLRIRTRLEEDVTDEGDGIAAKSELLLSSDALSNEKLRSLKMTTRFELEESVRVLGFNQGGEGVFVQGKHVNRTCDFAKGYICKQFKANIQDDSSSDDSSSNSSCMNAFTPREEIVIMCPTISGHSGGPCVNDEGKVVGILSRADPVDRQRCYLVPASELKILVNKAKKALTRKESG